MEPLASRAGGGHGWMDDEDAGTATEVGGPILSITRMIDDGAFTRFQVRAIALCALVAFLDGLDSQTIAVAAPAIADAIGLQRAALGPVFSVGLFGAMLGALAFGPLGDRYGRKRLLVGSTLAFGGFTVLTAYCQSYNQLLAIRFAAGVGLGGATPSFIALATEYAPQRRRAMVASLIWGAFPLGGMVGGFLNAAVLGFLGWRPVFLIGGAFPIVVALALLAGLPESVRYMIAAGAPRARIAAVAAGLRPGTPANARYVADEQRMQGAALAHLFTDGRAAGTLLLWIPFFTAFGILGLTVVWTPILLRDHGIPLSQAAFVLGIHGFGALLGMVSAGRLIERFGARPVLVPSLVLGGLCVGALGYAAGAASTMAAVLFAVGLFVGLGASGSIALATLSYPTAMRASGIGWAMGMGRFGQVLAPLLATAVVAAGWTSGQLFLMLAAAPALGALAILALRGRVPLAAATPCVSAAPGRP